ncbi:hypothetical protein AUJ14_03570 [Candidatus Micrarchaeota archaeon CG1_02_55_22]|nr:MAG: hypothetical protein AUJ14_03570 [Candidatus Micrarchaeota archaeon CG1_02_55_22]
MDFSSLRALGLNEYEAKAYAALASRRDPVAGRVVASESGVPPSRVYDVLRGLEGKGLVAMVHSKPLSFEAPDPEQALAEYAKRESERLNEARASALEQLRSLGRVDSLDEPFFKVYFGNEHRFTRSLPFYRSAKKRIWVISRSEVLPNFILKEIRSAIKRGVDDRVIATEKTPASRLVVEKYLAAGAKARYLDELRGFNQIVYDYDKVYQVFFDPGQPDNVCVVAITHPGFNAMAAEFFKAAWAKAAPV